MKYTKEIIAGCTAGILITGILSWQQWQQQDAAFVDSTRVQVHALARLAQSQQRKSGAIELPTEFDPWGSPYAITGTRICSLGPDRRSNTSDDICAP